MNISIRTKRGWKANIKNENNTHCDRCGEKLWISPSDEIYCNGNWKECKKKVL